MTADIVTISHNNELDFYHYNIKYSSNIVVILTCFSSDITSTYRFDVILHLRYNVYTAH